MDNGNGGPGNRVAQNFERSMAEAPQFDPETLPVPEKKETEQNTGIYIDPSMLGASTVQAAHLEQPINPELGEVVTENEVGMKSLSEAQISGTDIDMSKFQKNGVSKELETKLDNLKKESNLYKQSVEFMLEAKKSLSSSFTDRKYLAGGNK